MDLTMDDSDIQFGREPDESAKLDTELEDLRAQIKHLDSRQQVLQSHLLSISSTQKHLETPRTTPTLPQDLSPLASAANAHSLTNLHRLCASCTAFHVQDPDPNALDSGRVLGIRIDVCLGGRFIAPYYILLNRISSSSQDLRIYKHTLPPCIPLAGLALKWLAAPPHMGADGIQKPAVRKQDLSRLVKEVRREVVGYHRRLEAVNELRETLGFMPSDNVEMSEKQKGLYTLKKLEVADAEAYMLRIEWADGKIGRVRMDKDGEMEKVVVVGDGRMRELEKTLMGREGERKLTLLSERLRIVAETE